MGSNNTAYANMLRTLADYIEMAEGEPKIRIGITFKLPRNPIVKIPVSPIDQFSASLGSWVSGRLIKTVTDYQKATGSQEGDELLTMFRNAQSYLSGLTKS